MFAPASLAASEGFPDCTYDPEALEQLEHAWAFNHDEVLEVVDR